MCTSIYKWVLVLSYIDFPGDSDCKESACNARDPSSTAGSGRSPGEGNVFLPREFHGQTTGLQRVRHDFRFHLVPKRCSTNISSPHWLKKLQLFLNSPGSPREKPSTPFWLENPKSLHLQKCWLPFLKQFFSLFTSALFLLDGLKILYYKHHIYKH